tara:strand:- start:223 stop:399 length:177 start_codon:yes stop_codon:yes gene_type:complete
MSKDHRLLYVDEEVRRLMREYGDLCFERADQALINAKHDQYMFVKNLQRKGVYYVPNF